MRKTPLFTLLITVFAFAMGAYLYRSMPSTMATHWGINGTVNGYLPRLWGVFAIPLLMVFLWILFLIMPFIDPKKKNIELFRPSFDRFILLVFMFIEYLYLITLAWNLGYHFDFLRAVLPTFAVIYYATGDLIEEARPNWTIGIRLPWTLSNKTVWEKTNRLGGKLFKYSAGVAVCTLIFPAYGMYLVIAPAIATALITAVYSYILYRSL